MARLVSLPFVVRRLLAVCTVILVTTPGWATAGGWRAAAARASITPPEPVWLAGYAARTGPSAGALGDLQARALALVDGDGNRLVIVSLEIIEIPAPLRDRINCLAKERHGLAPHELLVNVSHTHGGPMVSSRTVADWGLERMWGTRADAYVDFLLARIDEVIGTALRTLAPATLGHATTRCGFAMNRRLPTPEGVRMAPNPDGPVDHDVPVLRISHADGRLLAAVFGYACHATVLSGMEWCGDWPGFAQIELEKAHPGNIALFWAGCGADQNPLPRRTVELAQNYGQQAAAAVDKVLAGTMRPVTVKLSTRYAEIDLALDTLPTAEQVEQDLKSENVYIARRAAWLKKQSDSGGKLSSTYPYPIQAWKFGNAASLTFLGG